MIKIDRVNVSGFEGAIRGMRKDTLETLINLFSHVGVHKVYNKHEISFATNVSDEHKSLNLGTYKTEIEARNVVIKHQLNRFKDNILKVEMLENIYPCVYDGYFVSPNGMVFNRFGHQLKGCLGRSGYIGTNMWVDRKPVYKSFHRMIAESILPNPNNLPCINHKNGNKTDNRIENLEWCDYSYNTSHAYQTGLEKVVVGESHRAHKLTNEAVRDIRTNYIKGSRKKGAGFFAKKYGVSVSIIQSVVNYKTWRHVV